MYTKSFPRKIQTLAVSTPSVQSVLQSIGAGVYERARYCSESVNEQISDSSECTDVSELLFERALSDVYLRTTWYQLQSEIVVQLWCYVYEWLTSNKQHKTNSDTSFSGKHHRGAWWQSAERYQLDAEVEVFSDKNSQNSVDVVNGRRVKSLLIVCHSVPDWREWIADHVYHRNICKQTDTYFYSLQPNHLLQLYKCKKLTSLKLIVRTMRWYHSTKTSKIFWVTLDGATHGASISCPMHSYI